MTHYSVVVERETNGTFSASVARLDAPARRVRRRFRYVGLGALLGRRTSVKKTEAARRNVRKGGRPRKAPAG